MIESSSGIVLHVRKTIGTAKEHLPGGIAAIRGSTLDLVVVVVAWMTMLAAQRSPTVWSIGLLTVLCGAFFLSDVYGWLYCKRTRSAVVTASYVAAQLLLGLAIAHASGYVAAYWLFPLLLASQGVTLPRPWPILVCALVLAAFLVPMGVRAGNQAAVTQPGLIYLAALLFVVSVSHLRARETTARANAEQLAAELRAYATQAEELATARERNRLAREIHDSLGHYLTTITVQIEAARVILDTDRERAVDALDKAAGLARQGLAEVRQSVAALRAGQTDLDPLPRGLTRLVDEVRATGLLTELTMSGRPRPLTSQAELTLYRAAQEGLTNVCKHAGASRAELTLEYCDNGWVRLLVSDDGRGAETTDHGYGMLGLRERTRLVGGQASVRTAPGQGFALEVTVPG